MKDFVSWVHSGDLHITHAGSENYLDLLDLIDEVNGHLAGEIDFAFLPGDNADDGRRRNTSWCAVLLAA